MGFFSTLAGAIAWGTATFFFVFFLVSTGLIPGSGGTLLTVMGLVFLVVLAFIELLAIKL